MEKMVVVGNDIFDDFIRDDGYYVDKTEILFELVAKSRNKVTLFTRPRRFGKTLTMSMMESFFDIGRDSRDVFSDTDIVKHHPDFCEEWMNRYPVIFLSFKDVEGRNFEVAYNLLRTVISDLCKKHAGILERKASDPADAEILHRLRFQTSGEEEVVNSLKTLMRMMYATYGKPVILLIDEYDVPLAKARDSGDREYYERMLDMIRGIMSISLKTNEFLKFAVITGCLRISKESIFTGVNNFACYSVTTKKFSRYFGFTESEVHDMLDAFGMAQKMDIIKEWYDGYVFGNTEVFCPWDVANYLSMLTYDEDEAPQNFWANTSSNSILDEFVNHSNIDASEKFEILLNGGTITEDISEELTYDRISDSEKNLWSVLLMTGYISKADNESTGSRIKLRIPNAEIAGLFKDAVVERFKRSLDTKTVDDFIMAMWGGDEIKASELLSDILWDSISYFDYGEEYYHGMLNGIFTSRGYSLDSNDEAGLVPPSENSSMPLHRYLRHLPVRIQSAYHQVRLIHPRSHLTQISAQLTHPNLQKAVLGRLDLRVRDRKNRRLILLEFKRSVKEADLDGDCDKAIEQIVKKGYDKTLPEGYEDQMVYGIAFYAKRAMVKHVK